MSHFNPFPLTVSISRGKSETALMYLLWWDLNWLIDSMCFQHTNYSTSQPGGLQTFTENIPTLYSNHDFTFNIFVVFYFIIDVLLIGLFIICKGYLYDGRNRYILDFSLFINFFLNRLYPNKDYFLILLLWGWWRWPQNLIIGRKKSKINFQRKSPSHYFRVPEP